MQQQTMQQLSNLELHIATVLSTIDPRLGASYLQGRDDLERGEVTVATVMWASMAVLMAAALGVIIWNKVRTKGNAIDLDAPAAQVGQ